ncbi:hypothetical protein [Paractinoplanes rishiriensis]|nr:hypothetical protein [Actinoplanes rishiriensis]
MTDTEVQTDTTGRAVVAKRIALLLAGVLVLGYLIAVAGGTVSTDNRLSTAEILLAVAVVAAMLVSDQLSLYSVKDLSLGPGGISANFERIAQKQRALESEVRALQVAITGLVTKFEVIHLEKLAADAPALMRFGEIMIGELTHLDAMQFVRPLDSRGLNAIRQDHGSGVSDFDLKTYLAITREGLEYLALRAQLGARTATEQTRP